MGLFWLMLRGEKADGSKSPKLLPKDLPQREGVQLKGVDVVFMTILLIVAFATRFYNLGHPAEVVFDEQHFGRFTNWYYSGEYFLDIHPPLGKFFLVMSGLVGKYNPELKYERPGEAYSDKTFVSLRVFPALFGSLIVPLVYITMRSLSISSNASAVVAWMILCENSMITECR